jgi:hypothetical protein
MPDLDADVGNKLMVVASDHPITTMVVPITIVMVMPVFVVPTMIGTIHISVSVLIIPMMIDSLIITARRK